MKLSVETKDKRILSMNTTTNVIALTDDKDGYWEINYDYAYENYYDEMLELISKMNKNLNYLDCVQEVEESKDVPNDLMDFIYVKDIKTFAFDYINKRKYLEDESKSDIIDYTMCLINKLFE